MYLVSDDALPLNITNYTKVNSLNNIWANWRAKNT